MLIRLASKLTRRIFPNTPAFALWLHEKSARFESDQSYGNELKIIERILEELEISAGVAVDVAASDGLSQSCTYGLYAKGWGGLCIEMDPHKFAKLAFLYRRFDAVRLARSRVTPRNIGASLAASEIPADFEFLNLDIDSYDLRVLEALLASGYTPKVISMEINEKIPPEIFFTVEFDDQHYWHGDHFYGCSIRAANETLSKYEYSLVELEWNNAIFVHRDKFVGSSMRSKPVEEAYDEGYRSRPGREKMFPWNKNVDHWLYENAPKAADEIRAHFAKYEGKYTCEV